MDQSADRTEPRDSGITIGVIPDPVIHGPELPGARRQSSTRTRSTGARDLNARDYRDEKQRAATALIEKLGALGQQAKQARLRDGSIFLLKALLACPLPYRPTSKRQITRRARFDGGWFSVTYTACRVNVDMPYGADAKLMHWLLDRGLRQAQGAGNRENREVHYHSTHDYLLDCEMSRSNENYENVRASFRRLTGLAITVELLDDVAEYGKIIPLLEAWCLPRSIDRQNSKTMSLGDRQSRYSFVLSSQIVEHSREHSVRVPRQIWRLLKGRPRQAAILLWLYTRADTARSESKIVWRILREQLCHDQSNPRKLPNQVKDIVRLLRVLWPGANVRWVEDGLIVGRPLSGFGE